MPPESVPPAHVLSGRAPDSLSTLSTRELQDVFRETPTLPLASLLNRGGVTVDYEKRRVHRDSFWKGSFARDTLLGWEEKILTPIRKDKPIFAGGRFWKRFDEIRGNEAVGLIVNYGVAWLPGRPRVEQVPYPSDERRYVRAGDAVLRLSYLNHPYRPVVPSHQDCRSRQLRRSDAHWKLSERFRVCDVCDGAQQLPVRENDRAGSRCDHER